jgi:hypothetical protein
MRAGTHYLLDALAHVYHGKVEKTTGSKFESFSQRKINKGLYTSRKFATRHPIETTIFHAHYFHAPLDDPRLQKAKAIYLIGYPFDSFYSDGLIFSSNEYIVAPSIKSKRHKSYRLFYGSDEWLFLEPFMHENALWLKRLSNQSNMFILRYEDFFLNFTRTTSRLGNIFGKFKEEFPHPIKNQNRMYWKNNYCDKMDARAFNELKRIFYDNLSFFYPEKMPVTYN